MSRNSAVVVAGLAFVLACAQADRSPNGTDFGGAPRDLRVVSVGAPIAIGFFPLVPPTEMSEGIESAAEHFSFAISDLSSCLEPSGIQVEVVESKSLLIDNPGNRDVVDLSALSNESIGCYLVAPGRQPMIVRADTGASSLVIRCPSAAAVYFNVPECCPQGWTCCPDGSPIDEGSECIRR